MFQTTKGFCDKLKIFLEHLVFFKFADREVLDFSVLIFRKNGIGDFPTLTVLGIQARHSDVRHEHR